MPMDEPGTSRLPTATYLSVAAYPAAWRIEVVNNSKHDGFGYVRSELDLTRRVGAVH